MIGTPEYNAWRGLIGRCTIEALPGFKNYGGRGISVCERWRHSFENFFADMGLKPSPSHSIDRFPDNDGNYEPGNCRWATRKEQNQNTRSTRFLKMNGKTQCISEWCREYGIPQSSVSYRVSAGWSIEDAIKTPCTKAFSVCAFGLELSFSDWAQLSGLKQRLIRSRRLHGWSPEESVSLPSGFRGRCHEKSNEHIERMRRVVCDHSMAAVAKCREKKRSSLRFSQHAETFDKNQFGSDDPRKQTAILELMRRERIVT